MATTNKAPAKKAPTKEVAVKKKEEQTVMVFSEEKPDFLQGQQSNRGSENVASDDLVIPRLELVQSLSPCRKKSDPAYIEGAEEGMLYNNVTRQLYGESCMVVPVSFKKEWLLWKDRKAGGGFRGAFDSQAEAQAHLDTLEDKDQVTIMDTAQHFCLLINGSSIDEIVISMSKSKMKVSRNWNSMIRIAGGDRFSRVYRMNAVMDTNAAGEDFYNLSVAQVGFVTEAVYRRAEEMYKAVSSGKVRADRDEEVIDVESEEM